jgi:hypothetical protein
LCRHPDIADGRRCARDPEVRLDWAFYPQRLFEERRNAAAVLAQVGLELRILANHSDVFVEIYPQAVSGRHS